MIVINKSSVISRQSSVKSQWAMVNGLAVSLRRSELVELSNCRRSAVPYIPYLAITVLIFLFLTSCGGTKKLATRKEVLQNTQSQEELQIDTAGKFAKIVFDSSSYHFGTMKQGALLHKEIYFTNQGPGDLLIDVISACECTTLDWSRLPIKKGSRSTIKIIYNSKDKDGPQIVDIDITANTQPSSTFTKFYLTVEK